MYAIVKNAFVAGFLTLTLVVRVVYMSTAVKLYVLYS